MTGEKSGVKARLSTVIPKAIFIVCPAHKLHNVGKHAMMMQPNEVKDFITKAYTMLKSSNKLHEFKNIQKVKELPSHRILRWIKLRWVQLLSCVERIIEQWLALLQMAINLANDNDEIGIRVLQLMNDKNTFWFLLMLRHVMAKVSSAIVFFQHEGVVIHRAKRVIEDCYKDVLSCVMDRTLLRERSAHEIHPLDEQLYLPFMDFDLGNELRDLKTTNGDEMQHFAIATFNFVLSLGMEMRIRYVIFF